LVRVSRRVGRGSFGAPASRARLFGGVCPGPSGRGAGPGAESPQRGRALESRVPQSSGRHREGLAPRGRRPTPVKGEANSYPAGFQPPSRPHPPQGGRVRWKTDAGSPPRKRGAFPERLRPGRAKAGRCGAERGVAPPPRPALPGSPHRAAPPGKLNFPGGDRVRDLGRFPLNNFKFFELSFQSSLHLSLTVLVRYRTSTGI